MLVQKENMQMSDTYLRDLVVNFIIAGAVTFFFLSLLHSLLLSLFFFLYIYLSKFTIFSATAHTRAIAYVCVCVFRPRHNRPSAQLGCFLSNAKPVSSAGDGEGTSI